MKKNGDQDQEQFANELLRAAERRNEEKTAFLAIIQRLAELVSQRKEPAQACEEFAKILIEETNFENCTIYCPDREGRLSVMAAYGLENQLAKLSSASSGKKPSVVPAEHVIRTQEPVFIEDAEQVRPTELKGIPLPSGSLVCLPIGATGVLQLSSGRPRTLSPGSRRGWEMVAEIAGHLISRLIGSKESKCSRPDPATSEDELSTKNEIRKSKSKFNIADIALSSIPQGVCLLDSHGKTSWVNPAVERMQGGKIKKVLGRSPAILFREPASFKKLLSRAAASRQIETSDFEIMNPAGEVQYADISLVRLPGDSPELPGYLLVMEDVTGKKVSFEKMLQSEKLAALGTLAGSVSHEFNNLLMSILGNIQLILPEIENEEIVQRLQCLEKAVLDGTNTVRRLQRLTEREGEPGETGSGCDVAETVSDVIELSRPGWKKLRDKSGVVIDIELDLAPDCYAAINASDLREVLTNLVLNATDAMPEGGVISFKSRLRGGRVLLEISDTGAGMNREVAKRIFDPFFTTKGVGNSGLGLSVSQGLLLRYGAEMQVKSRKGKGTTFILKLPAGEGIKETRAAGPGGEKSSYRLLLVDDDPGVLSLMRDMLRFKGHAVVGVMDSAKALKLLETDTFDLVLTDLGMPGVNGWEVARQAKAKNPKTPVVMITGWAIPYEAEELAERGVDLLLAKPVSWDILLEAIDRMVQTGSEA